MNGGDPRSAPLRALRHPPALVDDLGVIPRIARAADAGNAVLLGIDREEMVRWTRAWLVVWQGALHERGVIGVVPPWTVPLDLDELPSLKGDPDRRRRTVALALLERSGVVTLDAARSVATLAEEAFVPHRAGLELDWAALCRTVRNEPAPLLAARALADLVVPADQATAVALRELAERTGYAPKQARIAVRRLIETGVIRVTETAGSAAQYWFAGAAGAAAPAARAVDRQPPISLSPPPTEPRPSGRRTAVRMTLNGVTFSLGAGLAPHVEIGPDGVPHVSFDDPGGAG